MLFVGERDKNNLLTKYFFFLKNLEASRDDIFDLGGLPILVKLLQHKNEAVQINAAWVLTNMSNTGNQRKDFFNHNESNLSQRRTKMR